MYYSSYVSRANDVYTEVQCNLVLNRFDKKEERCEGRALEAGHGLGPCGETWQPHLFCRTPPVVLRLFSDPYCAAFQGVARKTRGLGAGGSLTRDPRPRRAIQTRGGPIHTAFPLLLRLTYISIPYWKTKQRDRDYPCDCSTSEFSTCLY
jgi:hypothetical protein